jgi:hypothetical protein
MIPRRVYVNFAIILVLAICLTALATKWFIDGYENSQYYIFRDYAISACKNGDMIWAHRLIDEAVRHAVDSDLVSEGLHQKHLFNYGTCEY